MTPCHLLPASGQADIRSPMNWLRSLHSAIRVAGEGNVQVPSPAKKRTKAIPTLLSGLLRAEDMEPCNNSRAEEAGNFLSDGQL